MDHKYVVEHGEVTDIEEEEVYMGLGKSMLIRWINYEYNDGQTTHHAMAREEHVREHSWWDWLRRMGL